MYERSLWVIVTSFLRDQPLHTAEQLKAYRYSTLPRTCLSRQVACLPSSFSAESASDRKPPLLRLGLARTNSEDQLVKHPLDLFPILHPSDSDPLFPTLTNTDYLMSELVLDIPSLSGFLLPRLICLVQLPLVSRAHYDTMSTYIREPVHLGYTGQ